MMALPIGELTPAHTASFWAKVDRRADDECWDWRAFVKSSGYGQFSAGRRRLAAHRVAYVLTLGEPPAGLDLDHLCRNRACCNPKHLEPVTRRENLRRGVGNGSETHCPQGHSYDDAYWYRGTRKCRTCTLDRARSRYHTDPAFRAAKIASARRSYERKREGVAA